VSTQNLLCRSDGRDAYNLNQHGTTKTVRNCGSAMPLFFRERLSVFTSN
jgi:hypothetical protein